jgi:hypothetical protein
MANQKAENPMVLDTAGAIMTGQTKITQFEFIDYAVDTDSVIVTNKNGQVVWKANGASDLSPVRSGKIGWINGLTLSALTAGSRLLVWLE